MVRVGEGWDVWSFTTAQGEERMEGCHRGTGPLTPPLTSRWFIHFFSFIHQTFIKCPL